MKFALYAVVGVSNRASTTTARLTVPRMQVSPGQERQSAHLSMQMARTRLARVVVNARCCAFEVQQSASFEFVRLAANQNQV